MLPVPRRLVHKVYETHDRRYGLSKFTAQRGSLPLKAMSTSPKARRTSQLPFQAARERDSLSIPARHPGGERRGMHPLVATAHAFSHLVSPCRLLLLAFFAEGTSKWGTSMNVAMTRGYTKGRVDHAQHQSRSPCSLPVLCGMHAVPHRCIAASRATNVTSLRRLYHQLSMLASSNPARKGWRVVTRVDFNSLDDGGFGRFIEGSVDVLRCVHQTSPCALTDESYYARRSQETPC